MPDIDTKNIPKASVLESKVYLVCWLNISKNSEEERR